VCKKTSFAEEKLKIIKKNISKNDYSALTYSQASQYALENLEFSLARDFAQKAFEKSNFKRKERNKELLRKIKWIQNN